MNKGFSLSLANKKGPTFEEEDTMYAGENFNV